MATGKPGKLLAGLAVAASVFVLVEILLHLVLGPPPPPIYVWRSVGGQYDYVLDEGDAVRLPLLGDEVTILKRSSEPRVVFLGASSLRNDMDRSIETFPSVLARRLDLAVINLSGPGMDSHDLLQAAQQLEGVEHDMLVVYCGHNDFGAAYFQERYGTLSSSLAVRVQALLERLHLYSQLARWIDHAVGSAPPLLVPPGPPRADGSMPRLPVHRDMDDSRVAATGRHLVANLRSIAWLCRRRGVPMVFIVPASDLMAEPWESTCTGADCPRALWERGFGLRESDPEQALELLRQARDRDWASVRIPQAGLEALRDLEDEPGLTLVDAERLLPREAGLDTPSSALFTDQLHLTGLGHQAVADLIEPLLAPLPAGGRGSAHPEPPR